MRDARGDRWFVSFDAAGHPEAATGAIAVANKIFWALGYWQVENHLVTVDRRPDRRSPTRRRSRRRPDASAGWRRAISTTCCGARIAAPTARYRAIAARAVPGRPIGGFRYYGTRPDDPNDVVPHEHRRELRALKVFGAWTNLVDMKAGNTLDTVVVENGRSVVRHYLQDVGSTFGTGANGPREYDEGWELLYDGALTAEAAVHASASSSRRGRPCDYDEHPADRPVRRRRVRSAGVAAARRRPRRFLHARADDTFWAARRVAAFTDEMIRAAVRTGSYSDPAAEALLADVLIKRRHKIAARLSAGDQPARRLRARPRTAASASATPRSTPASPPRRPAAIASSGRRSTTPPARRGRSAPVATSPQTHARRAGPAAAGRRARSCGSRSSAVEPAPRRVDAAGRRVLPAHRRRLALVGLERLP